MEQAIDVLRTTVNCAVIAAGCLAYAGLAAWVIQRLARCGMDAQVIQVIEVYWPVGRGVAIDPHRRNRRYYTLDGKLLAEVDEWKEEEQRKRATTRPEASE